MPTVLNIFKIVIDFIWKVWTIPINLGDGIVITIWQINVYVILMIILIKFLRQDDSWGGDKAETFSTRRGKNVRH